MEDTLKVDIFAHKCEVTKVERESSGFSVSLTYTTAGQERKIALYFEDDEVVRELHVGDSLYLCLEART